MNEDFIAIQCKGIKKWYGEKETRIDALKGIDLEIHHSKLTLLVGPSGSGKTTLLSIIATILTPNEGQLLLLGQDITKLSEREKAQFCLKNLGIVFQSLYLVPTLSVIENISIPPLIAGNTQHAAREKGMKLLERMNLASRAESCPTELSRGQQQRVAIARAVVNDAEIILCDEPTSALDHVSGQNIMELLHELAKQYAKTVVVVTHDHRIYPYADRIIDISDGEITGEEQCPCN